MEIFKDRVGECDWCHTQAISLVNYKEMEICKGCHEELTDRYSPVLQVLKEQYNELINIFNRSGG